MAINHLSFAYVINCCICLTLMCFAVPAELGKQDSQYRLCLLAGAGDSVQIVQMQRNEARFSPSNQQWMAVDRSYLLSFTIFASIVQHAYHIKHEMAPPSTHTRPIVQHTLHDVSSTKRLRLQQTRLVLFVHQRTRLPMFVRQHLPLLLRLPRNDAASDEYASCCSYASGSASSRCSQYE